MLEKAEAIVLKASDYGETNKIVTFLTKEYGKIGLMARGAKKPKSRLAASTQAMSHVNILYKKGRGLGTLSQGEVINTFKHVKLDISLMAYGSYLVDLTDQLTEQGERYFTLFDWLITLFEQFNTGVDPKVLTLIFETKMLPIAGIDPQFDACTLCNGRELPFYFSIANGGFLCSRCYIKDDYCYKISTQTARLLRLFKHIDVNRIGTINLKKETVDELDYVISQFYEQYSGLRLKSKNFIKHLDRLE